MQWVPETFYTIGVEDSSLNAYGNPIGYALRTATDGKSRPAGL